MVGTYEALYLLCCVIWVSSVRLRQVKVKWKRSDLGLCSFHSLLHKLVQLLPLLMGGQVRAPSERNCSLQQDFVRLWKSSVLSENYFILFTSMSMVKKVTRPLLHFLLCCLPAQVFNERLPRKDDSLRKQYLLVANIALVCVCFYLYLYGQCI